MKFDRNTVIGILLLAGLFIGFFVITSKQNAEVLRERARQDSIEAAQRPKPDTAALRRDSAITRANDSATKVAGEGVFSGAGTGQEEIVKVSNDLFTVAFTNKGGQPKWVELNKFRARDSSFVKLAATDSDRISYRINTLGQGGQAETSDFYFTPGTVVKNPDGTTIVTFSLKDSSGNSPIVHQYTIRPDDYMIDFRIIFNQADKLFTGGKVNFVWHYTAAQQEPDITFEKTNTQVGYVEDGEFDYHTIGKRSDVEFSKSVSWIGIRQRFFNGFLIADKGFSSGNIEWQIPPDDHQQIVDATANLQATVSGAAKDSIGLKIFYGPADYRTLKKYDLKMSKLINLGQGVYSFVAPVNKYVILPVWDFVRSLVGSYGVVILLLTLAIRLLISPLTYTSYLSGAKMKALRPEIAVLKEKYGGDQQAMSMEQMKLFREAGVNPLGGCIPTLLQIPIFFALYSFFSANVDLRGASFLWAKDLSAYDDLIHFGDIPVISFLLGHHLSIFTLTAVFTSLLISLYSMSMAPDQNNPVLKYMPYIFPVFLLFIFNRLPAALTWYYTVSNVVTLALQFVIQNYIIDHNKILAQIDANRKKPKKKSKWQERVEQMQEQQKKLKEMQKGKR